MAADGSRTISGGQLLRRFGNGGQFAEGRAAVECDDPQGTDALGDDIEGGPGSCTGP